MEISSLPGGLDSPPPPLSPTLFLICTEGLSALINRAVRNQLLTSISICRGCPRVTHLLFADDSILFYKASGGKPGVEEYPSII